MSTSAPRVILWAEPAQIDLIRDAIHAASLEVVAVGHEKTAAADQLGQALNAPRFDDLRSTILRTDIDLIWIARPTDVGPDVVRLLRDHHATVVASTPIPASLTDAHDPADTIRFIPRMHRSPGAVAALDMIDQIGTPRCLNIRMHGHPSQRTIVDHLFDAMGVIDTHLGTPELIDAALCPPVAGVPETLRAMRGHLTVHLRFSDTRSATMLISDRAGPWERAVTIIGDTGTIHFTDHHATLHDAGGQLLDSHLQEARTPGALIGDHILRCLEGLDPTDRAPEARRQLAMCEAARLSCRTGQGESPTALEKMLTRV